MFTDMVGYTALTQSDEKQALEVLERHNRLLQPFFPKHNGKEVKTIGDSFLVEFDSALDAFNCAVEIQSFLHDYNISSRDDWKIMLRIGIHLGDVVHRDGDVFGDAVNIASRLQPLAEPEGICISDQVYGQVRNKVPQTLMKLEKQDLKGVKFAIDVYKVEMPWEQARGLLSMGSDKKRVAVLPFTNMSPDPNDKYFAEGMTEELISTVSKISELQVISRTSVMRYRDSAAQVSQIGQELSVGSVIEGSVRKSGNKVRITAQLIQVEGDRHVWSQSYDRDLTDVFGIQADIAEQVAGALKVQLLSSEKQSLRKEATTKPEAYSLYLKGRYYWGERTEENTKKALKYFEEATKVDPSYAMAYSGMADAYSILSDYGWISPNEALPLAMSYAKKALELDDSLAEVHGSMGLVLTSLNWDLDRSERELKRALELKPNYTPALHWYAVDLFYMRRYSEARSADQRALSLDPYSRLLNMANTNLLLTLGKYDEALKKYRELIEEHPDMSALRYWRSVAYVLAGKSEDAVKDAEEFVRIEGGVTTSTYSAHLHLAWVYASIGKTEEATRLVNTAVEMTGSGSVSPTGIGWVKVLLGDKEDGYRWLEKALEEKDPALLYFNGFPWTKRIRDDERWKAIEARLPFKSEPD